jgi:hypothetical protein
MAKQEKQIEETLKETQDEIRDFQLEKLKKLNELHMGVVLDVEKIQNLINIDNDKRVQDYCEMRMARYEELKD